MVYDQISKLLPRLLDFETVSSVVFKGTKPSIYRSSTHTSYKLHSVPLTGLRADFCILWQLVKITAVLCTHIAEEETWNVLSCKKVLHIEVIANGASYLFSKKKGTTMSFYSLGKDQLWVHSQGRSKG